MRRSLTRLVYFAALIAFAVYLGNTFAGGYIYVRGEGLVIGEPAVVAAEFIATVTDVSVKDGQEVKRGEIVSHLSSQYMSETRAKLYLRLRGAHLAPCRGEGATGNCGRRVGLG